MSSPLVPILAVGALGLGGWALWRTTNRDAEPGAAADQAVVSPTSDNGRASTGAAATSGNAATAGYTASAYVPSPVELAGVQSDRCRGLYGRSLKGRLPYRDGDLVTMRVASGGGTTVVRFARYNNSRCAAVWTAQLSGSPLFEIPWDKRPTDFDLADLVNFASLNLTAREAQLFLPSGAGPALLAASGQLGSVNSTAPFGFFNPYGPSTGFEGSPLGKLWGALTGGGRGGKQTGSLRPAAK